MIMVFLKVAKNTLQIQPKKSPRHIFLILKDENTYLRLMYTYNITYAMTLILLWVWLLPAFNDVTDTVSKKMRRKVNFSKFRLEIG